jgi:modification methylase
MAKAKKLDTDYRNKVYLTDSRDMRELPDDSVGLIVTSPPYFNIKDYAKDGRQEKSHSDSHAKQIGDIADFDSFIEELVTVWKECFRTLKTKRKINYQCSLNANAQGGVYNPRKSTYFLT